MASKPMQIVYFSSIWHCKKRVSHQNHAPWCKSVLKLTFSKYAKYATHLSSFTASCNNDSTTFTSFFSLKPLGVQLPQNLPETMALCANMAFQESHSDIHDQNRIKLSFHCLPCNIKTLFSSLKSSQNEFVPGIRRSKKSNINYIMKSTLPHQPNSLKFLTFSLIFRMFLEVLPLFCRAPSFFSPPDFSFSFLVFSSASSSSSLSPGLRCFF